jgi:hypothetical protein
MKKRPAPCCYACDAEGLGVAFQWIGGRLERRPACRGRHAWPRRFWPKASERREAAA